MIAPFALTSDPAMLADLDRRLKSTRWNDDVAEDWSYGTERKFLARLMDYWREEYRWPERVAELNHLPHFRATIAGYGVHFLHFRSPDAHAIPLLLMNGWPSSFVEYQRLAPLLASGSPSFHVVIPTLPGFGFSDRPTRPYEVEPADLFPGLMTALGYDRFLVSGTDIGSGIATRIALYHPDRVLGAHVSAVPVKPLGAEDPPRTAAESAFEARAAEWSREEGGYQAIQSTKPQSLAFGLADSPVGLASWIVEKFRAWTDCRGDVLSVWPLVSLIDNLMVYWTTNTIGASVRYYREAVKLRPPLKSDDFVSVPTAVAIWPQDLVAAPRELAARLYNVQRYTVFQRGGHFPAWEAPELYAQDLREFAGAIQAGK